MITTADESEEQSQPSSPSSASTAIYSDINDTTMKQIKMIDVAGSYGTKVDMMARHLIWIRNNDPGAKTLIFSQFADFLNVLRDAFKQWKIGASSIGEKNGIHQFKNDPAIECFLLDAKSDSSGLNLVNATYVFLCEPLINPAIELQAIARVHRIGQQRATTVFMYLVSDTVEQVIYDISVARRVEHMSRNSTSTDDSESRSRAGSVKPVLQETAIESANSAELEAALPKQLLQKKGEGEVVRKEDLWTCLFGGQKKPKVDMAELERLVASHRRADAAEERATEEGAVELTLREH
jgi:E3 ubiquitin-protein ligase SHPRH